MSTKLSTELDWSRSSTRRVAPPGGNSSISLSDDYVPTPPRKNVSNQNNPPMLMEEEEEKEDILIEAPPTCSGSIVIVVATNSIAKQMEQALRRSLESYACFSSCSVVHVPHFSDLPQATQYIMNSSTEGSDADGSSFDVIVPLGAILNDSFSSQSSASSLISSLNTLGLSSSTVVIPGIIFAENVSNAKKRVGDMCSLFAQSASSLLHLKHGELFSTSSFSSEVNSPTLDQTMSSPVRGGSSTNLSTNNTSLLNGSTTTSMMPSSNEEEFVPQTTASLLTNLRESLKTHGARGIVGLSRKFKIIDDSGNQQLEFDEFEKAMKEHTMDWTSDQTREVFEHFDEDGSGAISYDEFLIGVRGELNERRQQMVLLAFEKLDYDKNGAIELEDIMRCYSTTEHPDVISGKRTSAEVLREFLDTFDGGEKDGRF